MLGDHHRTLSTKAQFTHTILLQGGCCKRGCRFTRTFTLFNIFHYCIFTANSINHSLCIAFSSNIDFLAFNMCQLRFERFFFRCFKITFNGPIFLWFEGLDFALSFTDESNCYRLYTTSAESLTYFFPK